jgi:hypothetical protein
MSNTEVLAYILKSPHSLADFIPFCIEGNHDLSEPGVFEWLFSRKIKEAHFFTSAGNDSLQIFGATVVQPDSEPASVPWMDQIKGFERYVTKDGLLNRITTAPPQLQTTVAHNQYMDDEFQKRLKPVTRVFEALKKDDAAFSFTSEDFRAALNGSDRVDREAIFSEIEKTLGEPLFEKPDRARILDSIGLSSASADTSER